MGAPASGAADTAITPSLSVLTSSTIHPLPQSSQCQLKEMEHQLNVQGLAQQLTVPIVERGRGEEAVTFRFEAMPAMPAPPPAPAKPMPSGAVKGGAAAAAAASGKEHKVAAE